MGVSGLPPATTVWPAGTGFHSAVWPASLSRWRHRSLSGGFASGRPAPLPGRRILRPQGARPAAVLP